MVADATILGRAPPPGQSNVSMAQSRNQFGYRRHPDQDRPGQSAAEHPVVVVGAGPVGLSLAIDLAQRGQKVLLLDDADRIGDGSRAICFSKRSLEFWDRLGVGSRPPARLPAAPEPSAYAAHDGVAAQVLRRRRPAAARSYRGCLCRRP